MPLAQFWFWRRSSTPDFRRETTSIPRPKILDEVTKVIQIPALVRLEFFAARRIRDDSDSHQGAFVNMHQTPRR